MRAGRLTALLPALLILGGPVAQAHLVTTGLGPVYDGAAHFVLSPEDLVPLVALALLAGMRGPAAARAALFAVTVCWLLGGLAGLLVAKPIGELMPAASLLVLGGLVAADRDLPVWVVAGLAAALGTAHGFANGSALAVGGTGLRMLFGIVPTVFVVFTLLAAVVVALRFPLARIAVRVAGSWIAAAGILLLGWSLRGLLRSSS